METKYRYIIALIIVSIISTAILFFMFRTEQKTENTPALTISSGSKLDPPKVVVTPNPPLSITPKPTKVPSSDSNIPVSTLFKDNKDIYSHLHVYKKDRDIRSPYYLKTNYVHNMYLVNGVLTYVTDKNEDPSALTDSLTVCPLSTILMTWAPNVMVAAPQDLSKFENAEVLDEAMYIYMVRGTPFNIGHVCHDDLLPTWSQVEFLNETKRVKDHGLKLLIEDVPQHVQLFGRGFHPLVKKSWEGLSKHLYIFPEFVAKYTNKIVRIPHFSYGRGGFSGHKKTVYGNVYGSDKYRLYWGMRNHILDGLNDRHGLNQPDHREPRVGKKLRITMLNKSTAPRCLNCEDLYKKIKAKFPEYDVEYVIWEVAKLGYVGEVKLYLDTDILISMEGSVVNNFWMLRPGAVLLSLGRGWRGIGVSLSDFFLSSVDYLKVVYFLSHKRSDVFTNEDFAIQEPVFWETLDQAIQHRVKGFKVPIKFPGNQAHNAKICARFTRDYPMMLIHSDNLNYAWCNEFLCRAKDYMVMWFGNQWNGKLPSYYDQRFDNCNL